MNRFPAMVFLAFSGVAAASSTALAQTKSDGPVWGVYAGYNYATVGGSDAKNVSSTSGFVVAGTVGWTLDGPWSLQGELQYTQKGTQIQFDPSIGNTTVQVSYIEIPVLVRYQLPAWGDAVPFFLLGPDVGFKAGCSLSGNTGGATCSDLNLESTDFGVTGGFGLEFKTGGHSWNVAVRYDYGLAKLSSVTGGGNNVYSRTFTGAVGFKW